MKRESRKVWVRAIEGRHDDVIGQVARVRLDNRSLYSRFGEVTYDTEVEVAIPLDASKDINVGDEFIVVIQRAEDYHPTREEISVR